MDVDWDGLIKKAETAESALNELEQIFDLRWQADMRAIERWRKTTGKTLTMPDHADLCVWLMGEMDRLEKQLAKVDYDLGVGPKPQDEQC